MTDKSLEQRIQELEEKVKELEPLKKLIKKNDDGTTRIIIDGGNSRA